MNQKEYTLSSKDRKFLAAILFLHLSFVVMSVSFFGLYYKGQINDCRKVKEKLELAEWAVNEVNKAKAMQKIETMKNSYKDQGISAEEY